MLSRADYQDRLRAFWLSQSIANWTGLQTEGQRTRIPYYTDEDWDRFGSILNQSPWWSADDDTDIGCIYQHVLETYESQIPEEGVHTVELISNGDTVEINFIEYKKGFMLDMES